MQQSVNRNKNWLYLIILGLAIGVVSGVGAYTFLYAKGFSYMSNAPEVCTNCHVMDANYNAWVKSSHKNVAVCNDCHAPHSFLRKYETKIVNGFLHSFAFTTGRFPDPIRITNRSRRIAEQTCRYCHADIVQQIDTAHKGAEPLDCLRCHPSVGHLE
ncbi:MAG: cytochrome c nitrite reductase small subunit [Deltaproteobacteria bacterium]|nr:MAG: cytochrome c nitrite reductase small subunit [Deltaproteobacteria bacterium]